MEESNKVAETVYHTKFRKDASRIHRKRLHIDKKKAEGPTGERASPQSALHRGRLPKLHWRDDQRIQRGLTVSDQPRQHIEKQRHYFANKGPSSQGYGFSCGHIWMRELDCESWAP